MTYIDAQKGENYCYTPPYYDGEAWADIYFRPTETRKYTIAEIIASSSVAYYRYWDPDAAREGTVLNSATHDHSAKRKTNFINKHANA